MIFFNHDNKRGFTLVELMVVLAIVSLASSIVLSAVVSAKEKANISRAKSDVKIIVDAVTYAQGETYQRMFEFAPWSNYTAWYCTANGHVPEEQGCYDRVNGALQQIENATNGAYRNLPRRDPWGLPYQMDANYGETGLPQPCNSSDSVYLAGRTIPGLPRPPQQPHCP